MVIELEVVGPHRGKTFSFRNFDFVNGRIQLEGSIEAIMGSALYLERTQQAYLVGSRELKEAVERIHGNDQVHANAGSGASEQVPGGLPEVPEPLPPAAPDGGQGAADPQAGGAGVLPGGNGPEGTPDAAPENVSTEKTAPAAVPGEDKPSRPRRAQRS